MLHVKDIEQYVDDGKNDEAHEALDQLLALGPQNTAALKLRARLYEYEGRFNEELAVWDQIVRVDNEDSDAVEYLLKKQLEDREHFYFTDDLPGGGRRFLAYPRTLVNSSALGLLGCLGFLVSVRLAVTYPILQEPAVMLSVFGVLVVLPTLSVVATFIRSLKAVTVNHKGIEITTRLNRRMLKWTEIKRVCLARTEHRGYGILSLVIVPKEKEEKSVEINLNQGSSAVKARTYLIREITRSFNEPEYVTRESLELTHANNHMY